MSIDSNWIRHTAGSHRGTIMSPAAHRRTITSHRIPPSLNITNQAKSLPSHHALSRPASTSTSSRFHRPMDIHLPHSISISDRLAPTSQEYDMPVTHLNYTFSVPLWYRQTFTVTQIHKTTKISRPASNFANKYLISASAKGCYADNIRPLRHPNGYFIKPHCLDVIIMLYYHKCNWWLEHACLNQLYLSINLPMINHP